MGFCVEISMYNLCINVSICLRNGFVKKCNNEGNYPMQIHSDPLNFFFHIIIAIATYFSFANDPVWPAKEFTAHTWYDITVGFGPSLFPGHNCCTEEAKQLLHLNHSRKKLGTRKVYRYNNKGIPAETLQKTMTVIVYASNVFLGLFRERWYITIS